MMDDDGSGENREGSRAAGGICVDWDFVLGGWIILWIGRWGGIMGVDNAMNERGGVMAVDTLVDLLKEGTSERRERERR